MADVEMSLHEHVTSIRDCRMALARMQPEDFEEVEADPDPTPQPVSMIVGETPNRDVKR